MHPANPAWLPPDLAEFLALWNAKRGKRRFPCRADFSMDDLKPWFGRLNVMAVEGDEARFLIFSEESVRHYGREMTGKRLSEFTPESLAQSALADHRTFMAAGGVPMTRMVEGPFGDRYLRWTRLVVPLSSDGNTIDRYFVALNFTDVGGG